DRVRTTTMDNGKELYQHTKITKELKAEPVRTLKAHKDRVHTITMDNGKEFYQHTKITKALKAETYFCRPYHS
ncbi:hypothetical protein OIF71_11220, partial [Neisseria meningitidis]|nr:hypothetical protein [Neisseria meningitidis]